MRQQVHLVKEAKLPVANEIKYHRIQYLMILFYMENLDGQGQLFGRKFPTDTANGTDGSCKKDKHWKMKIDNSERHIMMFDYYDLYAINQFCKCKGL